MEALRLWTPYSRWKYREPHEYPARVRRKAQWRDYRARPRRYMALLLPPALVLTVLLFLKRFFSPVYAPNHFLIGILFGIPAGFLEEIGWMGYAFPKMRSESNGLAPSILLGLLWAYWLPFFLAFGFAMSAMRVLIPWIYTNTKSVLLAQLMHVSSTG